MQGIPGCEDIPEEEQRDGKKPVVNIRQERRPIQKRFDDIKNTIRKLEALLEVALLIGVYYFLWKLCYRADMGIPTYYGNGKYVLVGIYALLVFILFLYCDSFQFGHLKLIDVLLSQWIALLLVNGVTYFQLCLIANHMIRALPMFVLTGLDLLVTAVSVYLFTSVYHYFHVPRHMLMIYGNEKAITLKMKMDTRSDKYRIAAALPVDAGYERLCRELLDYDAVVLNDVPAQIRNDLLKYCYDKGIRTYIAPKLTDIIVRGADDITLFDTPLLLVRGEGLSLAQRFLKRAMDLVICGIAMIPGVVLMAVVALAIKLEDHGPVFYRQERVTRDGRRFYIIKFRSMIVDAEKEGKSIPATDHDPRITKVGRIIRATRIDEFPQVLNILKGDMSIVGPRPERVEHVEKYTEEIPEFSYREKVKGGLTGYAQIYGKYNTSAYDKLRLDLMYIENYSLLLDIKLIFMTLRIMLKSESTEGFDKAMRAQGVQEAAATVEGHEE